MYEMLADRPRTDWSKVHIFQSDERVVPAGDPSSNFGMIKSFLLDRIVIPDGNVHRIPVETPASPGAAICYEREIREFFGKTGAESPAFDLILLGLGADGHTASIFPGDPVIGEKVRWAVRVKAPPGFEPSGRVSLTLPVINAAKKVFFLVSGRAKSDILREILFNGRLAGGEYPAARVAPAGPVVWFADRPAYGPG
jgi:6-phosphogluconolactonase